MPLAIKCLILVAIVAIFFITEIIPLSITSIVAAMMCGFLGFIPINQVFTGFANPTVMLFAGMFVVGAAMFHTGLAQSIGTTVVRMAGTSENSLMFGIMVVAAVLSSVLSNTGTAACLLPVVLGICSAANIPASRQLMPLAFAAGLGGIVTLVGTSPNMIGAGALRAAGFQSFSFFEFAWIGIPLTIAGILYMVFVGRHLLPQIELTAGQIVEQKQAVYSYDTDKQVISGTILLIVILIMSLNLKGFTLEMAAVFGAILCVLSGCLTEKQAYESIDWVTIILFAGMMTVSTALDRTGAGKLIAQWAVNSMGGYPSLFTVTAVLFILSCGLTQFMSNTAAAALLCPIGISIAKQLGADPHAIVMTISVAASCAFATPIGTPANTLVLGHGNYKFSDYVKVGTGLVVVCFIVSIIIIPMRWPFFPK